MILIVDDKPENVFALKKLLELHNFGVDTALSGEEALKKVLKNSYALIILDVQMPGMDGFEVAEALSGNSKGKDIPIIFLSAINTDKKFITKGYGAGGIDYVAKPVDPDILLLKVKTFYRLYEQARELNETHTLLMREIETRKNAQYEQHRKNNELQSILESIPQIAFTANAAGIIEYVNKQWYIYSDHKNTFPEVYDKDTPVSGFWQNAIVLHMPLSVEVCMRKLYGNEHRFHLLNLIPVKEGREIVKWVGTFTDIHERKLAIDQLEKRVGERTCELSKINEELETSNADLQQFASVVAHDLKEPMRKIQVFSSIVVGGRFKENLDPEVSRYLHKINASSDRMTKLIDDLMDFSRLSVDGVYQCTDFNELVSTIITDLEILVLEKGATLNTGHLPALEVVPGHVRHVFQNIICNALKFITKGKPPVININAEVIGAKDINGIADEDGNYCRLTIADNGIGFDEKYLDKIFTIFQRLHSREEYEGTGIGLAIAKKIIDKHNGLITARSKEGEGATFIIVLPIHQTNVP